MVLNIIGKDPNDAVLITVILVRRLDCQGCCHRIYKIISKIKGVEETVIMVDSDLVRVKGTMDVDCLKAKLKGLVEVVSIKKDEGQKIEKAPILTDKAVVKKEKEMAEAGGDDDAKGFHQDPDNALLNKSNSNEPVKVRGAVIQRTVMLKMMLHREACSCKILEIILKFKGVEEAAIDGGKDRVTVKGTMDVNELVPYLNKKLKQTIEVVPYNKDEAQKTKKETGLVDTAILVINSVFGVLVLLLFFKVQFRKVFT